MKNLVKNRVRITHGRVLYTGKYGNPILHCNHFSFLSPIPSRKQKLKNIKMSFPKRSFPLLGGDKAHRGNIESVTLHQLDFVVIVTQC